MICVTYIIFTSVKHTSKCIVILVNKKEKRHKNEFMLPYPILFYFILSSTSPVVIVTKAYLYTYTNLRVCLFNNNNI